VSASRRDAVETPDTALRRDYFFPIAARQFFLVIATVAPCPHPTSRDPHAFAAPFQRRKRFESADKGLAGESSGAMSRVEGDGAAQRENRRLPEFFRAADRAGAGATTSYPHRAESRPGRRGETVPASV